ncbi:NADPH-dependent FMN reductase [Serinicoccus kebangsaanensis]|uniref:NADPH-dependent FMN reductase n=1 Tax=Serinicoccus kebangsaanensis TaxID=2602069 RepID=UPI00124D152C|nr:NAD(P)H-dependent oxidoreductase [Serinicoccus kebangsaanensis]
MTRPLNVLVLVGSLRADSANRRLADAAVALLPGTATGTISQLPALLPHYDQDLDADAPPESVRDFRDQVAAADALVVVTPEFNGSLPSVLKNAIDWASRPRGAAALADKPVAVLGASASPRAAQWAREDARRVLAVAGAQPLEMTVGLGSSSTAFDGAELTDTGVAEALSETMQRLVSQPVAA